MNKKIGIGLCILIIFLSLLSKSNLNIDVQTFAIMVITSMLIGVNIRKIITNEDMQKYKSRANKIGIILVSMITAFMLLGRHIFMTDTPTFKITFSTITQFILITVWIGFFVIAMLYFFERFRRNILKNRKQRIVVENIDMTIMKRRNIIIYSIICTIISVCLVCILDNYLIINYQSSSVTIEATSKLGSVGEGNEVWIDKIIVDSDPINLKQFKTENSWKMINDSAIIYNQSKEPSKITFNFEKARNIRIFLNKYAVAGIINIIDGNKTTTIDLSANDPNYINRYFIYEVQSNIQNQNIFIIGLKYISSICIIFLVLMLICIKYSKMIQKNRQADIQKSNNVYWKLFFMAFFILESWAIIFYPGNYSWDNLYQWSQATGMTRISDGHPILMTLVMKFITKVWKSPFAITTFSALIIATILATILKYLYMKGIKEKWLICITIIFLIVPTNIMMSTNVLKDVPSAFLALLLTYYIYVMLDDCEYFSNNLIYLIFLPITMASIYLLRHDAMIAYYLSTIFILIYSIIKRNYKILISCLCSFIILLAFSGPIPRLFKVDLQATKGVEYTPILKALGNVVKNDGVLSDESIAMLKEVMPIENWKEYYDAYNQDAYSFNKSVDYSSEIAKLDGKDVFRAYIDGLVHNPGLIIRDRIDGMDIVWNISDNNKYEPFKYYDGVMTFYMVGPDEFGLHANEKGVYQTNNIVSNTIRKYVKISENTNILSSIFWRSGIYLSIFLILIIFMLNHNKKLIWINAPIVGRTIAFVLALSCQHYRYVYYIPIIVVFSVLLVCIPSIKDGEEYCL